MRRSALVIATMASFLTPFLGSGVNVALPALSEDLGLHAVELGWVASSFLLASAVCLVPFGRAADMLGRRRVFLVGMGLFTVAAGGCALARHGTVLIGFRALQGMGAAMIFGTGLAILTSAYPAGQRGRVLGLNAAAVYLGLSIGPFVGGLLTRQWGWSAVFWSSVPLGLITAGVAWRGLPPDRASEVGGSFDARGSALYGAALTALMLGLTAAHGVARAGLLAAAVAAFAFLVRWENRVENPVLNLPLLAGNVVFARSNLAALINYSATFAVTFLLSLDLQFLRGLDPARAGLVLLTQSVVMAAVSPIAGMLSDRLEPRLVASAGMGLSVAGLAGLGFLSTDTPLAGIIAALVVLGAGFGLFSSPNTNAVMSSVDSRLLGVASATLGTMRLVGQMLSMGMASGVVAVFVGHETLTPERHGRFLAAERVTYFLFAGLCLAGVAASLSRGKVRSGPSRI
jgi:EmrB/QacA subfamily drug resistance transporter